MADPGAELAVLLADELGAPVAALTRLSAGANRETWAFEADGVPLILQRSSPRERVGPQVDEPPLLRHARAGGVSVPEIVASSSDTASGADHPIGPSFLVTRRLEGETIARRILRDDVYAGARERFVDDCARELAAIHALDPAPLAGNLQRLDDPVAQQRAAYEGFDDPHPVFDLALRWLERHRPPTRPTAVVHGDFRMGNLLVDGDGIAAVLDWELAHLGDPVSDLGWLVARAWRFGGRGAVGGLGTRAELLAAYAAAGGPEISPEELRWWEVLASLRWGVMTMLIGLAPSLEQLVIGRRVVETEYDLLLLIRDDPGGGP